jgi:hypothetical protein
LWQPALRPRSRLDPVWAVAASAIALLVAGGAFVVIAEAQGLTTAASESVVTVAAIEGTSITDKHDPPAIRYRVRLGDGSEARFASSHAYPVGTRLKAMVARGRITNRALVSGPYVPLSDE